ncbi:nucleotidyl transferase AbiEii/AbiGii toxin family protein [Echinicola rosea]|uniref:Nucleotidyl transferase AbiEii/AbiGii toxin family protein n=1 Tax=Echinicola rosea TaxID=1807691 RepID=A0ABQ1UTP1_9BACT|nr:nucleotidyl transferase AbiEii/AbiGii toxin family protein [Echinicola rosea]GGF25017.1 hypothetical protein GCM10011339_11410 [Echinicola rosea]
MTNYKNQVALLLNVLPEVARESCFALHGGTAINLFVRNMPRLSVDIDLTYIPVEDRQTSFNNINGALDRIAKRLQKVLPKTEVNHQPERLKLQIRNNEALIKIEVNQGIRGLIGQIVPLELCKKASEVFDAFCVIQGVPFGQLYGGKICAAMDRQHPRDIFDVKYLLKEEGFTQEIKTGFLFTLLSSKRPVQEILYPNFIDQRQAFDNQFQGMTEEDFTYENFESTRKELFHVIHENITDSDKEFILKFETGTPDWSIYDFGEYPAVQWKLHNLNKFMQANPEKHQMGLSDLKSLLNI